MENMEAVKPPNKKLPHQAILTMSGHIHSLMSDGRLSTEAQKVFNACFSFEGSSVEECDEKTRRFIEKVKELWLEIKKTQ